MFVWLFAVLFFFLFLFRYALIYLILSSLTWLAYYLAVSKATDTNRHLIALCTLNVVLVLSTILLYCLTYTKFYRIHTTCVSILTIALLCSTSLALLELMSVELFSPLGQFSIYIEIILLTYTMIPLRLWQNFALAFIYTILFEIGSLRQQSDRPIIYKVLSMRLLLYLCIHLVGLHILIMNVVRMRGTFIEVGQNLLVKRQLEMEKQVNNN